MHLKIFLEKTINIIFPEICIFCKREGALFCEDCQSTFDFISNFPCLCQKPKILTKPGKCRHCLEKPLDALFSALPYEEKRVQKLIQVFKYEPFVRGLAKPLAQLMVNYFIQNNHFLINKSFLVPIPASQKRLRWRGYNPAQMLAKEFSLKTNIPCLENCLIRTKETVPQPKLNPEQRKQNLKNAFKTEGAKIEGKSLYLIDDIYTTGATMEEAAKVLKAAGAKNVWGIVLARAFKFEEIT